MDGTHGKAESSGKESGERTLTPVVTETVRKRLRGLKLQEELSGKRGGGE